MGVSTWLGRLLRHNGADAFISIIPPQSPLLWALLLLRVFQIPFPSLLLPLTLL